MRGRQKVKKQSPGEAQGRSLRGVLGKSDHGPPHFHPSPRLCFHCCRHSEGWLLPETPPFPDLQGTPFLDNGLRGGKCSASTPSWD